VANRSATDGPQNSFSKMINSFSTDLKSADCKCQPSSPTLNENPTLSSTPNVGVEVEDISSEFKGEVSNNTSSYTAWAKDIGQYAQCSAEFLKELIPEIELDLFADITSVTSPMLNLLFEIVTQLMKQISDRPYQIALKLLSIYNFYLKTQ
jgi:hypothetical protein